MYADSAPMHSDGLPNEPKRSHMADLHHTLASLNGIILSQPPQVHRAYALPVYDGKGYSTPRVFRSGLTSCDAQSRLQMWSYSNGISLSYPPQHTTQLFISDTPSNASFCLTVLDDKLPVSVMPCDGSSPPSQSWLIAQGKGPGVNFTISSVAFPGLCIGLDLDSNDNFKSSALFLQSCDFFDSGLAVSWSFDAQSQPGQVSNSFAKLSCLSAIETANLTAFTYFPRP
jgi:hypothetical protein